MKGKLVVLGVGTVLGIGAVSGFLGVTVVDGPEGAVCIGVASAPVEEPVDVSVEVETE